MSIFPQRILSPTVPLATITPDSDPPQIIIEKDWWLLLYNICQQVLGNGGASVTTAQLLADIDSDADTILAAGQHNNTFASGSVQYTGPNGSFAADNNVIFGKILPNPTGTPGPCLLLGSGGGKGTPITFCIIQDQAFDAATPGNNLIVTSGETQPSGTANGGAYTDYGGASFGGTGGIRTVQGGTSANGPGGQAILQGGGNTNGNAAAGDAFVSAGQEGNAGANVHLIATLVNGVAGDVRIRINSTILYQFLQNGEIAIAGNSGTAGQVLTSGGIGASTAWAAATTGLSLTIATAKLTTGGVNGSMTFVNGVLTAQTQAT